MYSAYRGGDQRPANPSSQTREAIENQNDLFVDAVTYGVDGGHGTVRARPGAVLSGSSSGCKTDFGRDNRAIADNCTVKSIGLVAANPEVISGQVELVVDAQHLHRIVVDGILRAKVSVDIATADFKAMLVPLNVGDRSRAPSIVVHLARLARRGVEIRLLHAGVPSRAALRELKRGVPTGFTARRCPRLHAKTVIVDATMMYLGSANLTGAGLGAKGTTRRNFEWGVWTKSPPLIDGVLQQFNTLWEGQRCKGCGRKDICPVPLEEPQL